MAVDRAPGKVSASVGVSKTNQAVDKVDSIVEQEIADSRAVDRVSGNVDVSVGISERKKTINKIANNVDVKQEIAVDSSAADRASDVVRCPVNGPAAGYLLFDIFVNFVDRLDVEVARNLVDGPAKF